MKKILIVFLTALLFILSFLLLICLSIKSICVNTLNETIVSKKISSNVLDYVYETFPNINIRVLEKIENKVRKSNYTKKLTEKYFDYTINRNYDIPDCKSEINSLISENIELLIENNIDISEKQKESIINKLSDGDNLNKVYDVVYTNVMNNLTKEQEIVIDIYKILDSNFTKIILVLFICVISYLIGLLKKSIYRGMINLGIVLNINGFLSLIVIPIAFNEISMKITNVIIGRSSDIDISFLKNIGIIYLLIGIVLTTTYIFLNNKEKKKI